MNDVIEKCERAAKDMRKAAYDMALAAGDAHMGGGLSLIEIMAALYMGVMRYDVKNPRLEKRDRLIFSKGHGALALYAAMHQAGFIADSDLDSFKSDETYLSGHPSMNMDRGIEFSSGSLGQGLSLAVGSALALRRKGNTTSNIYVVLGDGECNEGSVWEAAASAAHYNLRNIIAVVDQNGLQYDGATDDVLSMKNLKAKWESFGFDVFEVDGHSIPELLNAFHAKTDKPKTVLAHTIKGKGVSYMEHNPLWHHARFTQKDYDAAIREMEAGA
jgi:transketolase